jgi:crotonobetaine/carnitine-CoA ligase
MGHPKVGEVAVVAVPADQEAGEDEVMACVVLAPGESMSPEELWGYCDRQLPYFAVPRYLKFLGALPKTPSEKVRKADLRAGGAGSDAFDRLVILGSMPGKG